jgi:ATP-binding cassette subfamily B protein
MHILQQYLKGYWKLILLALFLAAVNQVFSLLDPYVFRRIVDEYAFTPKTYSKSDYIYGVGGLILLAMGAAMVSRIAKNFQDYFVNVITQRLGAQIYTDGLKHSLELPYQRFEDQRSGETLGILQKVRSDVEKLISAFVSVLFTSLVGVIFVMVYALSIYWLIAPVYFAAIPLLGWMSSVMSRKIKTIQKKIVSETTSLAGSTTESLRNIELVKSLGLAEQEINRLNATTGKILLLELKKVRYIRSISFVQGTFVNFLRSIILFMLLFLIFREKLTLGQLFSLQIYSFFIFGPLQELGNIINVYRETEASLNNFETIINSPREVKPEHPLPMNAIESLEFKNVSFSHQQGNHHALSKVNFTVRKGTTIAFVGPSGSGKTTLVKLLVGLYQPLEGQILYNGNDGRLIDFDRFREQIGFVTQDTQLFSGTIRENLLFVKPDATDSDCHRVLDMAACGSLMQRAEKGLDTTIGEGGVKVSGGEKQRLSIARALLRNPGLMVFDEATSALDSITEEEISSTIRNIGKGGAHITILIAHRLSTIMHADTIFVLEKGQVAEQGKHEDLLQEKGLYYAMWRQQIGERQKASKA